MSLLSRRSVLAAVTSAPWIVRGISSVLQGSPHEENQPTARPVLDIHVHLMGVGDSGSGCRLSPALQNRLSFKLLAYKFQLRRRARTLDEGYVLALAEQIERSGVDRAVILAQDGVYDDRGRLDPERTQFYVPNDYLFQVAARYPKRMIPCVSINPDRADAVDELDRCVALGARVLKIHPPIQGVDIARPKHARFFRRCAEKKVVVMVHTGHEHAGPVIDADLARPEKLRLALDEGCTVVACHCGTGQPADRPDMLPEFLKMLRDYRTPGDLWGDTAILGGFRRSRGPGPADGRRPGSVASVARQRFPVSGVAAGVCRQDRPSSGRGDAVGPELHPPGLRAENALGIGRPSAERGYEIVCGPPMAAKVP